MYGKIVNNFDLIIFVFVFSIISPAIVSTFYKNPEAYTAACAIYFTIAYLALREKR